LTWGPLQGSYVSGSATIALYGAGYGNGYFVAVGEKLNIIGAKCCNDGLAVIHSASSGPVLYGVDGAKDIFIAVGSSGTILTSSDATTWTSRTSGTFSYFRRVFYKE